MLDKKIVGQYDSEIFKEALEIFVPDSIQVLSKIENSSNHKDLKSWAHRIKGSFLMIGANDVAQIAKKIENSDTFEEGKLHLEALKSGHQILLAYLQKSYLIEE